MRFASYNIKSGLQGGIDGLAAVLAEIGADVVGLQEVDCGTERAGGRNQAADLARRLGLDHAHFAAAVPWAGGGEYGVALLSRHPLSDVREWPLYVPTDEAVPEGLREPRILLSATVRHPEEGEVRVFVSHFGLGPEQRTVQARELAAAAQQAAVRGPVVVLADLNAAPDDAELTPLLATLRDAHDGLPRERRHTFPANATHGSGVIVDYVLVSISASVEAATVVPDRDEASDHDLCVADVRFGGTR